MATPPPVALITASSAGLGAAAARTFAAAGYRIAINYAHNSTRATSLLQDLQALSPLSHPAEAKAEADSTKASNFIAIQADLTSRADVQRLVSEAAAQLGRLDVVFSNGGWTRIVDFMNLEENMEDEDWDRCYVANVKSHLWLFHAARGELERARGAFVTTASTAGVKPGGSSLPYSVTKAAQIHLVKGLATIAAPNIRVNAISPSLMLTDWGLGFSQEKQDAALAATKLKRHVTVEDVAEQVLYLAKSRSTTGVNAVIDSGLTM